MGNQQATEVLARDNHAYRVIWASEDSPLETYLDFIIYTPNNGLLLSEYLQQSIGRPVCLKIYNMLQRGTRLVTLTPKIGKSTEEMLSVKLRFENYTEAHTYMIAIKDVFIGGPAHHAGLHPHCDFILGTP